jgi:hypothetical protein
MAFISDGGLLKKFSSKRNGHWTETTDISDIVMSHPSFRSSQRNFSASDGLLHPRSSSQHPLKRDTRFSSRYDHSSGYEEISLSDESSANTSVGRSVSSSSRTSNHSGSSGFHDDDLFPSQAATGAIIWCEVDTHGQEAGAVTVRVRCKPCISINFLDLSTKNLPIYQAKIQRWKVILRLIQLIHAVDGNEVPSPANFQLTIRGLLFRPVCCFLF